MKTYKFVFLFIFVFLTFLKANETKFESISKTFWEKGYVAKTNYEYKLAYKYYVISANQINNKKEIKENNVNYILWSIDSIKEILSKYPELSSIENELAYWDNKLINSNHKTLKNSGFEKIWQKATKYENINDYANAYSHYLQIANQIDFVTEKFDSTDHYILWSIKSIRKILSIDSSLSTIKDELEYWKSKLNNSKSEEFMNFDISEFWNKAYDYEKNKDYKNAYKYYLIAANLNDEMSMISIAKILEKNPELSTIENEIEYWYLKTIKSNSEKDRNHAITFLSNYYEDTNQNKKNLTFMQNMYKKYNNLEIGCKLSTTLYFDKQYIKSFDLAKEIYENNKSLPPWNSCIRTLSYFYEDGSSGISKNVNKAINLLIDYFNYSEDDGLTAARIGNLYLKEKKDYTNARRWYKIAYELEKNNEYLNMVDNYIKAQPIYNIEKKQEQTLFPIINNSFISKNIVASAGAYNDHYGFFATSNKDIQITDDYFNVVKSLRGWIGDDYFDGIVSAMAYDEFNKLLYVTGQNSQRNYIKNDIVKVFDIKSGKIVKTLNNINSFIPLSISISKDGDFLLAINNGGSNFNIINTNNNDFLNFKAINKEYLYGVIRKQKNDYLVYVLDKENFINIFSINKERLIDRKRFQGKIHFFENSILVNKRNNITEIYDFNFNLVKTVKRNKTTRYESILLSANESKLIFTTDKKIEIYNLDKDKVSHEYNFKETVTNGYLDLFNNLYYYTTNNIYVINLDTNKSHNYYSEENINNNKIIKLQSNDNILNIYFKNNKNINFDLNNFSFLKEFINPKQEKDKRKLVDFKIIDKHWIEIYKKQKLISKISLPFFNIESVKNLNNKYIWVDSNGFILLFNIKGDFISQLNTPQTIQNVIFSNDNFILTSGDDNLIHIWDLNKLKLSKTKHKVLDQQILKSFNDIYKLDFDKIKNLVDKEFVKQEAKKNDWKVIPSVDEYLKASEFLFLKKEILKPIASIYIKNEKDWIIYTPEGLFTYGGNGKDLLKYHQNQGLYKEAKIINNDQLFDKFYRPDLIKKILAGEEVEIPMDVKSVIMNIFPPDVNIVSTKMVNDKDVEVIYQVCDVGNGISNSKLLINGQAINPPTSRGFKIENIVQKDNCKTYKSIHTLDPGSNSIVFKSYDKDRYISNISKKVEIVTSYKNQITDKINNSSRQEEDLAPQEKSNLYFLSIAVNDYEDDTLDLTYPLKDVEAVKSQFIKNSKNVYEDIFTYEIQNNKVSKKTIKKTFNEISKKIKYNDTFVLYIAGHGITKDGKYQFLPYKANNLISIDELKQNLSKIYVNKSLVLLDTCKSGSVIDTLDDEATKNRLAYDSSKVNYIVASSSDQVALEGYKDHGVFTYSVLDAFKNNPKMKVYDLADYVSKMVPKITKEKFYYKQVPQYMKSKNFFIIGDEN